jgi:hypothetical protein
MHHGFHHHLRAARLFPIIGIKKISSWRRRHVTLALDLAQNLRLGRAEAANVPPEGLKIIEKDTKPNKNGPLEHFSPLQTAQSPL